VINAMGVQSLHTISLVQDPRQAMLRRLASLVSRRLFPSSTDRNTQAIQTRTNSEASPCFTDVTEYPPLEQIPGKSTHFIGGGNDVVIGKESKCGVGQFRSRLTAMQPVILSDPSCSSSTHSTKNRLTEGGAMLSVFLAAHGPELFRRRIGRQFGILGGWRRLNLEGSAMHIEPIQRSRPK
jgi:hypothetical protein